MKLARAAGLHVEQACFDGVGYVFQFHAGVLAEADQSLRQVGKFIDSVMTCTVPA